MICILLAAGYATRLYPLTINTPKPLLPVGKRPILDYILEEVLTLPDLNAIYVVTNHRFYTAFENWAAAKGNLGMPFEVIDDGTHSDEDKKGALGDIRYVIDKKKIDDDLLVVAGDNLFTYRLLDMYRHFVRIKKDLLIAINVLDVKQLQRLAVATLDADGRVLKMEEKPKDPETTTAIYATYLYTRETLPLLSTYLEEGNTPDAPGNFPSWLYQKKDVYAYVADGTCIDIGTPDNYDHVQKIFPDLWAKRKPL